MDATFFQKCDKPTQVLGLARQYLAEMVDSRQVRVALRELQGTATPEEFADDAGVHRATVYRILDMSEKYSPKIETISALVASRGLTVSAFFARIEGLTPTGQTDPRSAPLAGEAQHGHPVSEHAAHISHDFSEALIVRLALALERLADLRTEGARHPSEQPTTRKRAKGSR